MDDNTRDALQECEKKLALETEQHAYFKNLCRVYEEQNLDFEANRKRAEQAECDRDEAVRLLRRFNWDNEGDCYTKPRCGECWTCIVSDVAAYLARLDSQKQGRRVVTDVYYCMKCRHATQHIHRHREAHGLAGTHMAGSEYFECKECGRKTFARDKSPVEFAFVLDKQ